mmetsp:Transcript_45022/g.134525  ORF Transcript_45022/g.134525 Transcript_45022/m.134525 type:complete len:251 (+) Transcript_45022:423-1175(+)
MQAPPRQVVAGHPLQCCGGNDALAVQCAPVQQARAEPVVVVRRRSQPPSAGHEHLLLGEEVGGLIGRLADFLQARPGRARRLDGAEPWCGASTHPVRGEAVVLLRGYRESRVDHLQRGEDPLRQEVLQRHAGKELHEIAAQVRVEPVEPVLARLEEQRLGRQSVEELALGEVRLVSVRHLAGGGTLGEEAGLPVCSVHRVGGWGEAVAQAGCMRQDVLDGNAPAARLSFVVLHRPALEDGHPPLVECRDE